MTITKDIVLKTADLARLKIPMDKVELYTEEISKIISFIDTLNEVDTTGVEEVVSVDEFNIEMQKDEVQEGNYPEKVLQNAPKQKMNYFVVPKVIG